MVPDLSYRLVTCLPECVTVLADLNNVTVCSIRVLLCDLVLYTLTSLCCLILLVVLTVLVSNIACPFLWTLLFIGPLAPWSDLTMLRRLLVSRNVKLRGNLTVSVSSCVLVGVRLVVSTLNLKGVTAAQSVAP